MRQLEADILGMDRFGLNQSSVIRKSPVVIVKNFMVLQLTAVALFFLSAVLLDYGDIYEHLPFSTSISFHIAEAVGLFSMETVLVFFIFFRWHKEYYDLRQDRIVYGRGIIFRRQTVVPIKNIGLVSFKQGPLGKITKYGDIEIEEKSSERNFVMDHIPEPQLYVEYLMRLRENASNIKQSNMSVDELLSGGEHEHLEFKTSFRWDARQGKVNKNLEKAVMKTIVAFLNSDGGQLLMGVDDSGNVVGLETDFKSLPKPNVDGFQNHFTNVFHVMVGPEFRQFIELNFAKVGDKDCCLVKVVSADKPAYLKVDSNEEFFIRTGNGTTSLKFSEASSYINSHWKARLL